MELLKLQSFFSGSVYNLHYPITKWQNFVTNFLSSNFSPLTSDACERSSQWLWKENLYQCWKKIHITMIWPLLLKWLCLKFHPLAKAMSTFNHKYPIRILKTTNTSQMKAYNKEFYHKEVIYIELNTSNKFDPPISSFYHLATV